MILFKKVDTRKLASILLTWGLVHGIEVVSASIKIINGTKKALAFALVRTETGSKRQKLYIPMNQKEPKKNDNAWELFKENLLTAFQNVKQSINVKFLIPDLSETLVMSNFPQKIREYDRVLWIVPLKNLGDLVSALNKGAITAANSKKITALEVGSALTAEIIEKNGKFAVNTTGKLSEGAKALYNRLTGSQEEVYQEQQGESLLDLTTNRIQSIQKDFEQKQKRIQNKKTIGHIKNKYGR